LLKIKSRKLFEKGFPLKRKRTKGSFKKFESQQEDLESREGRGLNQKEKIFLG